MSKLCRKGISRRAQTAQIAIARDKNFDRMLLMEKIACRTRRMTEPIVSLAVPAPIMARRHSVDCSRFSSIPIDSELLKRLESVDKGSGIYWICI